MGVEFKALDRLYKREPAGSHNYYQLDMFSAKTTLNILLLPLP